MKNIFACVLTAALLSAPVQAQQVQPIDSIAVVVEENVILQSELDRAVANIRTQYADRTQQLPPPEVLQQQVAERLVLLQLQVARAEATGVRITDQDVDQAIAAIAGQNRVSVDQLRMQVTGDGSTFAQFRDSIRDELLVQRLRQRFAQTQVSVSDAEVEAALESQQAGGEQFHLAHILVALPEAATPEQIATGKTKVDGIKSLIERGEMGFAAAAVRYSDSPNALEGGDLGWRAANEIPAAFSQLVRSMQPGEITDPIRGPSGFQLLQLVETRDSAQAGPSVVTQFQASHILIRVDADTTIAQAKAEADTLHARIVGGADFAELAREHSEDPSSQSSGGELGWFTQRQFGPDFGGQVAALADGEVSAPFRTQAGWHIVKRTGVRQSDVGDDNQRAQAREMIGRRKLEDEWSRFLRELRGEAYVDFRNDAEPQETPEAAPAGDSPTTPPADG